MNPIIKVIELSGILDGIKGDDLRRKVTIAMANKADIVLIDLKDVKFVDDSSLAALISAMQIVRNANGELFVCSVSCKRIKKSYNFNACNPCSTVKHVPITEK